MSQEFRRCRVLVVKMHHKYVTKEMRHDFQVTVVFLGIADREETIPLEQFSFNDQAFLKMNYREPLVGNEYELEISDKWLKEHHVPDGAWKK